MSVAIGKGGSLLRRGSFYIGPVPPLNPVDGDIWFNTAESKLYLYGV